MKLKEVLQLLVKLQQLYELHVVYKVHDRILLLLVRLVKISHEALESMVVRDDVLFES